MYHFSLSVRYTRISIYCLWGFHVTGQLLSPTLIWTDGWSVMEPSSSVYSTYWQLAKLMSGSHISCTFMVLRDEATETVCLILGLPNYYDRASVEACVVWQVHWETTAPCPLHPTTMQSLWRWTEQRTTTMNSCLSHLLPIWHACLQWLQLT
jgi:hypothetical protein